MNRNFYILGTLAASLVVSTQSQAGLKLGDPSSNLGQISFSGFARAKYESKDWSQNDNRVELDTVKLYMKYDAAKAFGQIEYSCYQYNKVCDFSSLINAYVGYKINETDTITAGFQPVPFGPGRFWESNYYGTIVTQIGLEDVHNVGIKYSKAFDNSLKLDVAYFAVDGGDYVGSSNDSARYPVNLVKPDPSSAIQTHLNEENMFVASISKNFLSENDDFNFNMGGSYWYSDVKNETYNKTGNHQAWALFSTVNYNNLSLTMVGGENKLNNKDPENPDVSVAGAFDFYNYMANDGVFYSVDVSYPIKISEKFGTVTPYMMFSGFNKDKAGFKTSTRNLFGTSFAKDNWLITAEYILGKNDLLIGGNEFSLAEGSDDKTHSMLKVATTYNF